MTLSMDTAAVSLTALLFASSVDSAILAIIAMEWSAFCFPHFILFSMIDFEILK